MHLILARSWTFFALVCFVSVLAAAMASRSASIVLIIPTTSTNRSSSRWISTLSRGGKRPTISGAHLFQLLHPIAAQRLVVIDAMDREQSLDPVDVLDTFVNQPATLTMAPTVVLFGDTRHAYNTPNLRLTT